MAFIEKFWTIQPKQLWIMKVQISIYPFHLFGEISRRGEISLKMTNIALVRALRIWVAQRMYWHILPKQGWSYILVKMSIFWKFFFAFSNVKSLNEYVVKILALKFEPKKSYGKKSKFSLCKNALIGPDLEYRYTSILVTFNIGNFDLW